MKPDQKRLFLYFLLIFIFFISCSKNDSVNTPPPYTYDIPEQTDDGWITASAEDFKIDVGKLAELTDYINFKLYKNVHSVLLVKDGFLVFEQYFEGYKFDYNKEAHLGMLTDFDKNSIHNQASVTKSFTSALVGIAFDKGFIQNLDEKVYDIFSDYPMHKTNDKTAMTIEHLLTMTSGFEWNEGEYAYADNRNDLIQMWLRDDPLEVILEKPLVAPPGTQFYYNSGCTNLLGEIVRRKTGLKADKFAERYLFTPLGINKFSWEYFSNGVVFTSGDLQVCPRAMAKLGYLYLNKGIWNGKRIISEEWITKSTARHIDANSVWQYGYQWWLRTYGVGSHNVDTYSARGWGGQTIIVAPSLNAVIVFTGGNYITYEPVDEIVSEFILPALL